MLSSTESNQRVCICLRRALPPATPALGRVEGIYRGLCCCQVRQIHDWSAFGGVAMGGTMAAGGFMCIRVRSGSSYNNPPPPLPNLEILGDEDSSTHIGKMLSHTVPARRPKQNVKSIQFRFVLLKHSVEGRRNARSFQPSRTSPTTDQDGQYCGAWTAPAGLY